jgi:ABC-type phosphate/phosphonate transport system substrate-binding protein
MKRILHMMLILGVVVLCASTVSAEIKIGMLAQRGAETALKEWGGLETYLTDKLGEKVTVVPLKFTEFMDFCDNEPTGFIFTNPWFYVRAKVLKGAKALATVRYQTSGDKMCGVIFTRKDSGITSLGQLRNKTLMCPKLSSPGGWLYQKGEIVKAGVVPEHDLANLLETKAESHDEVVFAVRDKKVDVGTVRNNILETMQREGKISMQDFLILNQMRHPGVSEACSTPLYPDWAVAALGKTPPELADKVKQALLGLPPGDPALVQARKIEQFEEPLDYAPMEELCKRLIVEPFRRMR